MGTDFMTANTIWYIYLVMDLSLRCKRRNVQRFCKWKSYRHLSKKWKEFSGYKHFSIKKNLHSFTLQPNNAVVYWTELFKPILSTKQNIFPLAHFMLDFGAFTFAAIILLLTKFSYYSCDKNCAAKFSFVGCRVVFFPDWLLLLFYLLSATFFILINMFILLTTATFFIVQHWKYRKL